MILVVIVTFVLSFIVYFFKIRQTSWANFPGPKPYPIIGNALQFLSEEPLNVLRRYQNQFGRIYHIALGTDHFVILTNPIDVEVILSSTKYISKSLSYKFLSWLKEGLITLDGNLWFRHRKLLTTTFHFKILENSVEVMHRNAEILAMQLESQVDKNDFNVLNYIEKCSLDIICESAMDLKLDTQSSKDTSYLHAVKTVTEITVKRIFQLWLQPEFLFQLSSLAGSFRKSLNIIENLSKEIITSKREKLNQSSQRKSIETVPINDEIKNKLRIRFLDFMLTGSDFTDDEVHGEVMSFVFAGHDTTTAGISFVLHQLAQHQEIQEKVYDELQKLYSEGNSRPSIQKLNNLKYTECVIKESLRLYPSVPIIARTIHEEVDLPSGYKLPAKTEVNIFIYGMHRDPTLFEDPEKFIPERFSEENNRSRHPFSFIAFSAGPRNCIGQKFALLEIKIVLITLLKKFRVLPANTTEPLDLTYGIILRARNGVSIRLSKRN